MNWVNVRLIFLREVRDQMRDRRTLFMIAVLPILLYPMMGVSFLKVAQFLKGEPAQVLVLGRTALPEQPPLIEGDRFATQLFSDPETAELIELRFDDETPAVRDEEALPREIREALRHGQIAAVVSVPPDFSERLAEYRQSLAARRAPASESAASPAESGPRDDVELSGPMVFYSSAKEKSQVAEIRIGRVLGRWEEEVGRLNLITGGLDERAARPFAVASRDVAEQRHRDAVVWSKLLPFVLLLWALTGAFYPAIDLCAGEKERGTLETLLSSPAERGEIVWGKLLTIMVFSMATAILNLLSMALTGGLILAQLPAFGPPPPWAALWLLIALVPVSALFSALCLALAAFARSSKEGQYYLMPLVLVITPLVTFTMWPNVELNLGYSLIPVTGVVLLLRTMLEGDYLAALRFAPPVIAVTLGCCLLAIRWAVDQFNRESVLFRESERLDVSLWLKHLMRDRGETPSAAEAVFCGVLILVIEFFLNTAIAQRAADASLTSLVLISQVATILTPALIMTVMLTRSPRKTLLLHRPRLLAMPAAVLLAVCLHPAAMAVQGVVNDLYPFSDDIQRQFQDLFDDASFGRLFLLIAVVPAICEELAFRGFILSGLRHLGRKRQAIVVTAVFFGLAHPILQQSILATLIGLVIGYLAVQSGSLLPCMLYHMTHNGLLLVKARPDAIGVAEHSLLGRMLFKSDETGYLYDWPIVLGGSLAAAAILYWFARLPYARTDEESLQEAIEHDTANAPSG